MNNRTGNPSPQNVDLLQSVYAELRRIAAAQMIRQPRDHTLQPTALVHEAWLRLNEAQSARWANRAHLLGAAVETMRHILIDRARRRRALRHGGGQQRIDVEKIELPAPVQDDEQLLAIDVAVDRLTVTHPEVAQLVKLHCFGGLEITEAGKALGMPRTTAYRRWLFARAWLQTQLR
jgi:RNA polymerase sigma factor (TIGR02999 family)